MRQIGQSIDINLELTNSRGVKVKLEKILNQEINIVYFYPKDGTPGCTLEACEFRDANSEINALGAQIIGISKDNDKSHNQFTDKYKLNFELYSDSDNLVQNDFGVWLEKSMFGKSYMGTQRSTFILNKSGKVLHVWDKVNPLGHSQDVLNIIKKLKSNE